MNLYQEVKSMLEDEIKPIEDRTEASLLLIIELLKKLNAKSIISDDDLQEIFQSAVDNADAEVAVLLDELYGMLNDANAGDGEVEGTDDT